ncbi:hypothetical protein ACB092_05G007900 [Castanea dentata]
MVSRKARSHVAELFHIEELLVVEGRDLSKNTNYVRMLVNMCSLTVFIPPKRSTNKLLS